MHMHMRVRVHHWVIWWVCLGVVCGVVALVNIFMRDLPRSQERVVLLIGALNWLVGGVFCYGFGGIKVEELPGPHHHMEASAASTRANPSPRISG